ncbi:MAG TPA: hypothetical protein RMH99_23865 [Sandaracinaceae bacterium LLY-WYZ-13_1]|nr:hypothetical protein [Sandaracinaceae bacterium LLY-WYZ-13_1]
MDDARLVCFGDDSDRQLGEGPDDASGAGPVEVALAAAPTEVGGGLIHGFARTADGAVHCWGTDGHAQVDGSDRDTPAAIGGLLGAARALTVGGEHNCVVVRGEVWCWGRNHEDQLGTGGGDRSEPARVSGILP